MKRFSQILPLLAIAMLFALPSFAQTGNISGKVLDRQGQPLAGVLISIDRLNITGHFEVKTDAQGAYSHAGLPTGQYKVAVMENNLPVDINENVRVSFGGTTDVSFDLRKISADAERAKIEAERKAAEQATASFNEGRLALTAKNYEEAARLFQIAATNDPTQHVIFANLAESLNLAKKYPESEAAYKKAIELKPDEAVYHSNLGYVLAFAGKVDEATQALEAAAKLSPATAGQGYYNLGAVLTNRNKIKEAGDAFKKATELDPTNAKAYFQLGISYIGSPATMKDAVPAFEKFLTLEPTGQDAETAKQLLVVAKGQ